jgi:cyclophilin family peptidyl-prolyl cis-trans isomerase
MRVYYFVILVFTLLVGSVFAVNPQVTLHVTGADANGVPFAGDIVLELYPDEAPVTVENFINYVQSGFYDGLIFHRVIEDFMVQGGGYDPDYNDPNTEPPIINESSNGLSNLAGTVAMARTSNPHTATSEFFINHIDNLFLDYALVYDGGGNAYYRVGYCVFGEVISGMSLVNTIAVLPVTSDRPDVDVIIQSAVVTLESPICAEELDGDIDGDCDVDLVDFAMMAENWLVCNAINGCP